MLLRSIMAGTLRQEVVLADIKRQKWNSEKEKKKTRQTETVARDSNEKLLWKYVFRESKDEIVMESTRRGALRLDVPERRGSGGLLQRRHCSSLQLMRSHFNVPHIISWKNASLTQSCANYRLDTESTCCRVHVRGVRVNSEWGEMLWVTPPFFLSFFF